MISFQILIRQLSLQICLKSQSRVFFRTFPRLKKGATETPGRNWPRTLAHPRGVLVACPWRSRRTSRSQSRSRRMRESAPLGLTTAGVLVQSVHGPFWRNVTKKRSQCTEVQAVLGHGVSLRRLAKKFLSWVCSRCSHLELWCIISSWPRRFLDEVCSFSTVRWTRILRFSVSVLTQDGEACSADASALSPGMRARAWKTGNYFYDVHVAGTRDEGEHFRCFGSIFGLSR